MNISSEKWWWSVVNLYIDSTMKERKVTSEFILLTYVEILRTLWKIKWCASHWCSSVLQNKTEALKIVLIFSTALMLIILSFKTLMYKFIDKERLSLLWVEFRPAQGFSGLSIGPCWKKGCSSLLQREQWILYHGGAPCCTSISIKRVC